MTRWNDIRRREFLALCSVAVLGGLTACTPSRRATVAAAEPAPVLTSPVTGGPVPTAGLRAPALTGLASVAQSTPATATPSAAPVQAGAALRGRPLPTNQWWTSALIGKLTLPMWAVPIAAQVSTAGIALSGAQPTATADHIVTAFLADVTAGSTVQSLEVTGFGAFHVELAVTLATGAVVAVTLVQGCPIVYLRFTGGASELQAALGAVITTTGPVARITVGDRRWVAAATSNWIAAGTTLRTSAPASVAVGLCPMGTDLGAWANIVAASAADPITATASTLAYDSVGKLARQTLTVTRASGRSGPMVLMPHHRRAASGSTAAATSIGTYQLPTGEATVIIAAELTIAIKAPDPVVPLAVVDLSDAARAAVLADIRMDLADPPGGGGSYNGAKELGRLATIAEVARVIGANAERSAALVRLKPQLVDWLSYSGPADDRYFAYDPVWGGLIGVPAEFGCEDYNDHHLQYGYFVRAAAVLAESDPQFLADYGSAVDAIVADYAGSTAGDGLPVLRVFQPYLGHSGASGFVPFADGNNQESSSEAIQSWQAMARWGAVRGNAALIEQGRVHYALETNSALLYWLGETPGVRPSGYAHSVVGILWDAKVDFATWFSPLPEAVFGIQLIPLTEGSVYRHNATAALTRSKELRVLAAGPPRMWGDLFAADLAIADPDQARARLDAGVPREPSTGRGITRYWVELQAAAS